MDSFCGDIHYGISFLFLGYRKVKGRRGNYCAWVGLLMSIAKGPAVFTSRSHFVASTAVADYD